MTNHTAASKKSTINSFSSITPGLSVQDFLEYKPNRDRDQDFDSYRNRRGKGPNVHNGTDYGSRAKITKGTKISSVMSGVATPIENYYTKSGVTDSGVVVTGKDSKGQTVKITYGHLSAESVKKMFNGKTSVSINAGDIVGAVGSTGKDGRNEYHTHVRVEVDGKVVNPVKYFQQEYESQKKQENALPKTNESTQRPENNPGDSIAVQRYQAIANILKDAGIQPGSSDWNKAIIQTAIGTDLEVGDIKDIAKQIPGISANEAEKLVDVAGKNAQATLA
jgi:Peptidase family M23